MNSRQHTVIRPKVIVKTMARGRLTIPKRFRATLGIDADTLLAVSLVGDHLEVIPLARHPGTLRRYRDRDIEQFLEEDRLDAETANRIRALMKHAGT